MRILGGSDGRRRKFEFRRAVYVVRFYTGIVRGARDVFDGFSGAPDGPVWRTGVRPATDFRAELWRKGLASLGDSGQPGVVQRFGSAGVWDGVVQTSDRICAE